jgi:hypothetical protein
MFVNATANKAMEWSCMALWLSLVEQIGKVEPPCEHRQVAVWHAWPFFLWTIRHLVRLPQRYSK